MLTNCYSYYQKCPCLYCDKNCCFENTDDLGKVDTEKLCKVAKKHCEECAKRGGGDEHN